MPYPNDLARKDAEEFTNKEILSEFEENYMNILERKKQEGIQIGMEKGEFQKAIQTARKMRDLGLSIDIIEKSVGLTERELK
jgi:predicted transposase/invertase (TIGR01784 family)